MFTPEQKKELEADLKRSNVKTRKQSGRQISYVEGWHVIAEANRIFGFDGWSSETVSVTAVAQHERGIGENKDPGWGVTYTAKVRIEVHVGGGIVREGVGTGHGIDRDLGQAHESAIKEAETDARKRALMTFGNQFGLALYDKSQENVEDDTRKPHHTADLRPQIVSTPPAKTDVSLNNSTPDANSKARAADWALQELAIIRAAPTPRALRTWEQENRARMEKLKTVNPDAHQDLLDNIDARAKALLAA